MANDLNRAEFIGRLGADPEIRHFPDGGQLCNIRIAVGSKWKNKQGEPQERTEWVPVTFRGKLAEIAAQYLQKGSQVYVSGEFRTRKWQDKDGSDRYSTEIVVDGFNGQLQMLGGRGTAEAGTRTTQGAQTPQRAAQGASEAFQAPGGGEFDDQIPFDCYLKGSVA